MNFIDFTTTFQKSCIAQALPAKRPFCGLLVLHREDGAQTSTSLILWSICDLVVVPRLVGKPSLRKRCFKTSRRYYALWRICLPKAWCAVIEHRAGGLMLLTGPVLTGTASPSGRLIRCFEAQIALWRGYSWGGPRSTASVRYARGRPYQTVYAMQDEHRGSSHCGSSTYLIETIKAKWCSVGTRGGYWYLQVGNRTILLSTSWATR